MKDQEKRRGLKVIVIAVAIALVMTILTLLLSGRAFVLTGAVNTILRPGRALMVSLAELAEKQFAAGDEVAQLEAENERLRTQVAELQRSARESERLQEENVRLRGLVGLQEKNENFDFESATVVAWGASNWTSEFTISKGTEYGIEAYDCVVTEAGYLVGIVEETGVGWATVRTILDTDFSMGVSIYESTETAVAEGSFDLMKQGYLRSTYIPADSSLRTGYTILTSGLGGNYPMGLTIGTVATVATDVSGLTDYAIIRPAADIAALSAVYVIKNFDIVE